LSAADRFHIESVAGKQYLVESRDGNAASKHKNEKRTFHKAAYSSSGQVKNRGKLREQVNRSAVRHFAFDTSSAD
jgi:hypothetical protein